MRFYWDRGVLVHPDAPPGASPGQLNFDPIIEEFEAKNFVLVHGQVNAERYLLSAPKNLVSLMCIPLVVRTKYIGILALYSYIYDVRFTEGQRKMFSMLGSRTAAAIDNALLYNNLQQTFRQTIQGLARAIEHGGTTLRDFLDSDGQPGYFARELLVYARENLPCFRCQAPIRRKVIGQRSSYYCPRCQR